MRDVAPPNGDSQAEYARLFIPSSDSGINAVRWRIALADAEKVFSGKELAKLVSQKGRKELGPEKILVIAKLAASNDFVLDEYERTLIFLVNQFVKAESLSPAWVVELAPECSVYYARTKDERRRALENDPEMLNSARRKLRTYGEILTKHEIRKIRAKVAFQEIVCAVEPDVLVPVLVSLSPSYLCCPFLQRWIRLAQQQSLTSTGSDKERGKKRLGDLFKALGGDRREDVQFLAELFSGAAPMIIIQAARFCSDFSACSASIAATVAAISA